MCSSKSQKTERSKFAFLERVWAAPTTLKAEELSSVSVWHDLNIKETFREEGVEVWWLDFMWLPHLALTVAYSGLKLHHFYGLFLCSVYFLPPFPPPNVSKQIPPVNQKRKLVCVSFMTYHRGSNLSFNIQEAALVTENNDFVCMVVTLRRMQ